MSSRKPVAALLALAIALAGIASPSIAVEDGPYYVRHAMQAEVNPAIMAVWDTGNAAMSESGTTDLALLDDADWTALAEAAGTLEQSGRDMAAAQTIRAAPADDWATGQGEVTMDQVQAALDADPAGFRRLAAEFADKAAKLAAAARARDADVAGELVGQMDAECAACHAQFWYAE